MRAESSIILTAVCCLILFCKTNAQNFSYSVNSPADQNNYGHQEVKTAEETRGSYYVLLPDGRLQTVTYRVDAVSGFVANITYTYPSRSTTTQETTSRPQPTVTSRRPPIVHTLSTTVRPPARTEKPKETTSPNPIGSNVSTTTSSVDNVAVPDGPPDYLDIPSYDDFNGGLFNGEDSVVIPDPVNNFFFPQPVSPIGILFPGETGFGGNSQTDEVSDNSLNGLVFPGEENPNPPPIPSQPEPNELELLLTLFNNQNTGVGGSNPNSNVGNENSLGYDPDFPPPPEFN